MQIFNCISKIQSKGIANSPTVSVFNLPLLIKCFFNVPEIVITTLKYGSFFRWGNIIPVP